MGKVVVANVAAFALADPLVAGVSGAVSVVTLGTELVVETLDNPG